MLRACRDASTLAKTALRIAKRRKLLIDLWELSLNKIQQRDWEKLRNLALAAEDYSYDMRGEEYERNRIKMFETSRFFGEIVNAIDVTRPPLFTFNTHITPCAYCGLPTDRRSLYFCASHIYDGKEYRKVRRMEAWTHDRYKKSLMDLVKERQKTIGRRYQKDPDLFFTGTNSKRI